MVTDCDHKGAEERILMSAKKLNKSATESIVESLLQQFLPIAEHWRSVRRKTGQFLRGAQQQLAAPQFAILQGTLKFRYQINYAEQAICMRIADGDVSSELADLISASTLQQIPTDRLPDPDHTYRIYSPTEGKIVSKLFREFTSEELSQCVGSQGVIQAEDQGRPDDARPFRSVVANSWRRDGVYIIAVVHSLRAEVKIHVGKN